MNLEDFYVLLDITPLANAIDYMKDDLKMLSMGLLGCSWYLRQEGRFWSWVDFSQWVKGQVAEVRAESRYSHRSRIK